LSDNDSAIISNDHYITKKFIDKISNKKRFNLIKVSGKNKKSSFYYDDLSIYKNSKFIYKSSNPNLYGSHNLENISLVVAFLSEIDRLNKKSLKAINSFKGLSHRQEILRKINKTTFINDSKATNIDSSIPALKSFKNIHWICGGIPKSHDMKIALPYLKNVKKIYVIGLEKDIFFTAFERYIEIDYLKDMKNAVQSAFLNSKKEKKIATVLLSPAAASFDQYKNFETRGNAFKKYITNL
jgi:UDP-N-acetylmuramoylalanine--D-glutamate ligase